MRVSVRALLLNEGHELIVFRRELPGREVYWSAPGGKIDRGEDDETALRRELFEELGAVCGGLRYLFAAQPSAKFPTAHRFYLTRLVSMDLSQRTGREFRNPAKGTYAVEQIPCASKILKTYRWVPRELATYLEEHADSLPDLAPEI